MGYNFGVQGTKGYKLEISRLFRHRHNNQPFAKGEKVGKQSFLWAERLTEMGAQFEAIEVGRAANMTSQTSGVYVRCCYQW